jgi:MerR family transcriptional regulator, light-induced transcriptional regulator
MYNPYVLKEPYMSLLQTTFDTNHIRIAQKIFDRHFAQDPKLAGEMDERRRRLMFQDILYNFSFLTTAVHLEDEQIFSSYALWLYELLCSLMRDLDRDRIRDQMVTHYEILREYAGELFSGREEELAVRYLNRAIMITDGAVDAYPVSQHFAEGAYAEVRREYLSALMRSDTKRALAVIAEAQHSGISLDDIYEQIIMAVMREVGELWHQNRITVDKEHYCTSTTQMVLSSFYPIIFSAPRKGGKILTCCVGSELHEMGGRMVSDLFEYHGWDTYYIGAAVPLPALIHAVGEYQPDIVALSVTMPQHLQMCRDAVFTLREQFPSLLIAVGGRAFTTSNAVYSSWPIDKYADLATELIAWAQLAVSGR